MNDRFDSDGVLRYRANVQARAVFGGRAAACLRRLILLTQASDSRESQVIGAALASICDGANARPIRLDELRELDHGVLNDLICVMLGTDYGPLRGADFGNAFGMLGGQSAKDWFCWFTTGGPHHEALERIVDSFKEAPDTATTRILLEILRSVFEGGLSSLGTVEGALAKDLVLLLEGLFGRDRGKLHPSDIRFRLGAAGLL